MKSRTTRLSLVLLILLIILLSFPIVNTNVYAKDGPPTERSILTFLPVILTPGERSTEAFGVVIP